MEREQELTGGNAGGTVVRAGDTVRKRWSASTPSVHALLAHLRDSGIDVPAPLGRDEQGRQILEHVPGALALGGPRLSRTELQRVGALVRSLHDASTTFRPAPDSVWETAIPAPGDELVCHNDLAPWNLVTGERWVFIDWDAAAPSTRLWDLAYAAQTFTLNRADDPPARAAADLRAFIDGYGADDALRSELPAAMLRRATAMLDLLRTAHASGREPWATMHAEGHGAHWVAVVDYVARHQAHWKRALTADGPR